MAAELEQCDVSKEIVTVWTFSTKKLFSYIQQNP